MMNLFAIDHDSVERFAAALKQLSQVLYPVKKLACILLFEVPDPKRHFITSRGDAYVELTEAKSVHEMLNRCR